MTPKVLRDGIVVTAIEEVKQTQSGLFIPATTESKTGSGKVVAVGSGHLSSSGAIVPLEINIGDIVLYPKSLAVEVKSESEVFFILREEQVICILPEK
jgi:chaperonin GroES